MSYYDRQTKKTSLVDPGRKMNFIDEPLDSTVSKPSVQLYGRKAEQTAEKIDALAKSVHYSSSAEYFVRTYQEGFHKSHLVNPVNDSPTENYERIGSMNLEKYPFKKVNEATFGNYLNYLATGNPTFLTVAERERKNA